MRTHEERLDLLDEMLTGAAGRGLLLQTPEDEPLDGRTIALDGRRLVNFGSCSYLGLELDARMREAVCDAVMRYGTQFSSSRTYLSAPPYAALEERLSTMFGGHALLAPSTSLAHLAALPVLVGSRDAVVLDQQVHSSVQVAADQLRVRGVPVEIVRHNRLDLVEEAIAGLAGAHERIWYLADGVYSMYADLAPFAELTALLERHPALHLYVDDSHGVGWAGRHGRGPALEALGMHDRLVVAASLNKSFAAAGGALVFPTEELRRRVRTLGGPMIFSGPVQPPMLGAAMASAAIHLSPELERRQAALHERISLCTELLEELELPLASTDVTPIRYLTLGLPSTAQDVVAGLRDDGFYTNLAMFPAVPMKRAGVRLTLTLHHEPADIRRLVEALARRVPEALARAVGTPRAAARGPVGEEPLRLEHHRTIATVDAGEWDALLGERGTFACDGLRFLERAFGDGRPEDRWDFHYYVVRDGSGRPVLATFFTTALWKDDMLSAARVSELVELRRADDPYYLTSRTLAMGSLLTEGDHLYLDRGADWRAALDLLLDAVGQEASRAGAGSIALRDLADGDAELDGALRERGFVAVAMPEAFAIDELATDDETWLAGLSPKARVHQRRDVLPWDEAFSVEVVRAGGRVPTDAEFDHLFELYRNVRARSLELNSFELPRTILRDMLRDDCWELVLLRLADQPAGPPVAFGAHYAGARHYVPMIVGLDYAFVRSHHSYRQALRQALLRARERGADRVLLGMGAGLEKRRFGAVAERRLAYVQAGDHYAQEVLAALTGEADAAGARRTGRAPGASAVA